MNVGIFAGRLGADCVLRSTPGGKDVCNFDLAVDMRDEKTLWVRCAMWGEFGKKMAQYLRKGKSVTVIGAIDVRTYESKQDGKTHAQLTCNVSRLTLQGSPTGQHLQERAQDAKPEPAHKAQAQKAGGQGDFDDDIPF